MPIRKVPLFTPEELEEIRLADERESTTHKLSREDVADIVSMAKKGSAVKRLAEAYEVDPQTICYHLKKYGVKPVDSRKTVSDEIIERARAMWDQGLTYSQISKLTGLTANQIQWYCVAKKKAALKNSATNEKNHF